MNRIQKYIIIDDDAYNNIICKMIMQNTLGGIEVKTFEIPEEGLLFIQNEYYNSNAVPTILFLDINMPSLSGWDFMEQYEKFGEEVKKQISIYIVSSSLNQGDVSKAEANKYIKGFISKPMQRETILSVAAG